MLGHFNIVVWFDLSRKQKHFSFLLSYIKKMYRWTLKDKRTKDFWWGSGKCYRYKFFDVWQITTRKTYVTENTARKIHFRVTEPCLLVLFLNQHKKILTPFSITSRVTLYCLFVDVKAFFSAHQSKASIDRSVFYHQSVYFLVHLIEKTSRYDDIS